MKGVSFNNDWQFKRVGDREYTAVTLPHDAMILEERSESSPSGGNGCYFAGNDYEYVKTFTLPKKCKNEDVIFEFEGVYQNAYVFLNDELIAQRKYGYTNFYAIANEHLFFDKPNTIKVVASNSLQPNSRWYSGAGIYRPVTLWTGPRARIAMNGIKVKTKSISPVTVEIEVKTTAVGEVTIEILDGDEVMFTKQENVKKDLCANFTVKLPKAELWSCQNPRLYVCRATFGKDTFSTPFGIRAISFSAQNGFTLNGERVVLRGACIHHDNGILGARCFPEAEERKIALLKENGYNAVRSAHNPCSKALLAACDRLGVLVMDEYVDMWYIHKTKYDYADHIYQNFEQDITDMVEKDFNHPSVIMYSLGNEVAETGQAQGISLFDEMKAVVKKIDTSRAVTVGVNIFFNYLYSIGLGQYSDKKAEKTPKKKVGSEFFNNLAGLFGSAFMKNMAKLPGCDAKTRDCFAKMDVAGYNYGIERYEKDVKNYPYRIIVGSETFCADAYRFWNFAKTHPSVIGDFVWAGIDYLGEVGIGAWEYKKYAPDFSHGVGWMTAGSGRLDLIGTPLGEALYTKVAFELEQKPQIAVVPVDCTYELHTPSAWKFSNAIPSWSWGWLEGKMARVEVYSRAPMVKLYVNGRQVGQQKLGNNCRYIFNVAYQSGEITAVACNASGRELSRNSLTSAWAKTVITVLPEKKRAKVGELVFVKLQYTDERGIVKPLHHGTMEVTVKGGELVALGNARPYNPYGYNRNKTKVYYGQALAVVRVGKKRVTVFADNGELQGKADIIVD